MSVSQCVFMLNVCVCLFVSSNITEKSSGTVAQEPNLKSQVSPAAKSLQEEQITTSLKGDTGRNFTFGLLFQCFLFSPDSEPNAFCIFQQMNLMRKLSLRD